MAEAKPFDFSKLPKISGQEAKLIQSLQAFLPRIGFTEDLRRTLKLMVARELGLPFDLEKERVTTVAVASKLATLTRQGVYLVFGMAPLERKAILELDPLLAHMAIDKLIGGPGTLPEMVRPLTEIENGVLSYLFLKILSVIYERCGSSARVQFRLEGIDFSPDRLAASSPKTEDGILITYRLTLGKRAGYARLILPSPVAQKIFLEPLEGAESEEREREFYGAKLANLGFLDTVLWGELGRTTVTAGEINRLEPGDVIVLEKTSARVEKGNLAGTLAVRVGRGEQGSLQGTIIAASGDRLRLEISGVVRELM